MKKIIFSIIGIIFIVVSYIGITTNKNNDLIEEKQKKTKLEDIQVIKKEVALDKKTENKPDMDKQVIQNEFKKCFNKEIKNESVEQISTYILKLKEFSNPSLSEENYEIIDEKNNAIVVQYIPQEESSNQIRVFSINPADGLPDRIKNFPNNQDDLASKLKGALSLGKLKSKMTSTTQTTYDGSLLSLDKKDNKILRLHLMTRSFDFECKDEKCSCFKKE